MQHPTDANILNKIPFDLFTITWTYTNMLHSAFAQNLVNDLKKKKKDIQFDSVSFHQQAGEQ